MADYAHRWTDERLKALEHALTRLYAQAIKEMSKNFSSFMSEYEKEHNIIKDQLRNGIIDNAYYKDWLRTQAITERWYSEAIDYLTGMSLEADKQAVALINDEIPRIYAENYNWGVFAIEAGTNIKTAFTLVDEDTVRLLIKASANSLLPKNLNVDVPKDMHWNMQHFKSALMQGILQGESIENIAKRIMRAVGMNLNSALRNARTATTGAENRGRIASYERAKNLGIKLQKKWIATLDGRTRHSHRQLDGVSIDIDQTFDNGCKYPGDPDGPGSEVYNCRCTLIADIEDIDISDGKRASKLGDASYKDWKDGHV